MRSGRIRHGKLLHVLGQTIEGWCKSHTATRTLSRSTFLRMILATPGCSLTALAKLSTLIESVMAWVRQMAAWRGLLEVIKSSPITVGGRRMCAARITMPRSRTCMRSGVMLGLHATSVIKFLRLPGA